VPPPNDTLADKPAVPPPNDTLADKPAVAPETSSKTKAAPENDSTPTTPDAGTLADKPPVPPETSKPASDDAGRWGHLVGRFVYDGPPPAVEPLSLNKDIDFCSQHNPVDESLVVHAENRGLAHVVVRLETKSGDAPLPVHPQYNETAEAKVLLDNRGCGFAPHICLLRTSQTLAITNSDDVSHNTAAYLDRNDPFNEVTGIKQTIDRQLKRPERMPVQVKCSIHPWMTGWLVVSDHPYAAVSDADGRFRIEHVPAGERTFQVWQEKAGWIAQGTRDGQPIDWKRGRVTLTIREGENDLGEIRVAPAAFAGTE